MPDKDKKLAEGKKARIRAACSLPANAFATSLPPFYHDWVKDGMIKEARRMWLTHHLCKIRPIARLHASTVYVSDNMVKDVKAVNYGRGSDLAYADCHRGLTPFMCPAVPAKRHKEMDQIHEWQTRATLVTPDDIHRSKTGPGNLPRGLHGLLQHLSHY